MVKQPPRRSFPGRVAPLVLSDEGLTVATARRHLAIPAGIPGERVSVAPPHPGGRLAEVTRVIEPSPLRTLPPCGLIARCGGCSLQEMRYDGQLDAKREALIERLRPLRLEEDTPVTLTGLPSPFGYRTKLLMPAENGPEGLRFGLYRRETARLVPAEGCPVQHPLTLGVLATVRQVLDSHGLRATAPDRRSGWLHAVGVRVDPPGGKAEVTLAGRSARPPRAEVLAERLGALPPIASVHVSKNAQRSSYLMGPHFNLLSGEQRAAFHIAGQRFLLSPGTFVQTSATGADLLAEAVTSLLPQKMRCLADLYGGAGIFSRLATPHWERALVIEESPSAVADLRWAIEAGDAAEMVIRCGRVEEKLDALREQAPDVVLLDPPRRGCKPKVVAGIVAARPDLVIYVACGVDALVRDGERLIRGGFRLDSVAAVDMFPHTSHLETVVRFRRR